jgi:hypothetical protein
MRQDRIIQGVLKLFRVATFKAYIKLVRQKAKKARWVIEAGEGRLSPINPREDEPTLDELSLEMRSWIHRRRQN